MEAEAKAKQERKESFLEASREADYLFRTYIDGLDSMTSLF